MAGTLSAQRFVNRLESYRSPAELEKLQRHFKPPGGHVQSRRDAAGQ